MEENRRPMHGKIAVGDDSSEDKFVGEKLQSKEWKFWLLGLFWIICNLHRRYGMENKIVPKKGCHWSMPLV